MPEYSVQQTLVTTSSLPKDYVQNTWSIRADDVSALTVAVAQIHDFYEEVKGVLSNNVVQNGHPFKCYDRAQPTPRVPVLEGSFDFTAPITGTPLPHECAIVLSFHGAPSPGIPQARNRGRVYLGPISTAMVDADARISTANQGAIATAGNNLLDASDLAGAWTWVIWSTVMESSGEVVGGWVDNDFDTQRRRGRDSTERAVFP